MFYTTWCCVLCNVGEDGGGPLHTLWVLKSLILTKPGWWWGGGDQSYSLYTLGLLPYIYSNMKKKLPSLELTTLYWFCSISAQILKTRAIYVCPNYDNQESAWEAVLIAVCCIGFQLHWITFIILQLPLCIRLPLLLSHWISLHLPNVTPLHMIALYCSELH